MADIPDISSYFIKVATDDNMPEGFSLTGAPTQAPTVTLFKKEVHLPVVNRPFGQMKPKRANNSIVYRAMAVSLVQKNTPPQHRGFKKGIL